jgi:hypothetical protein
MLIQNFMCGVATEQEIAEAIGFMPPEMKQMYESFHTDEELQEKDIYWRQRGWSSSPTGMCNLMYKFAEYVAHCAWENDKD